VSVSNINKKNPSRFRPDNIITAKTGIEINVFVMGRG